MAYISRATGYPDYNSNATTLTGFIPELFEGKVIENLYEEQLISKITTTEYSGEIKGKGDSVVIPKAPPITISDYEIGTDLTPQHPTSTSVLLTIDQAKSFFITVDDIDQYESHLDLMNIFATEAAKSMADTIDSEFFEWIGVTSSSSTFIDSANEGTTAGAKSGMYDLGTKTSLVTISASNALQVILQANAVLDEQSVPRSGRWIVIPAAWSYYLKNSDLKNANEMGDSKSVVRTSDRSVGFIDGTEVFVSNNLYVGTDGGAGTDTYFVCPFGDRHAIGYANQITKTSSGDMEKQFAQYIKGLSVFGYESIDPKRFGRIFVTMS